MKYLSLVREPLAPHRGGGSNNVNHHFFIANKLALFPIALWHSYILKLYMNRNPCFILTL